MEEMQEILSQHGYQCKEFLGSGSFSSVYLCESSKYHQQFAVKKAIKHKLSAYEYNSLISLNHPHIVQLYDSFEDDNWRYLVTEYCPNGTILKKKKLSFDYFVYYARQILDALSFCHSQKIAHRDIKPENIFIDQYDHVKLADFGLARQFEDKRKSTEKCGSLIFFAPEMFECNEICPFKADIWALGITFFFMATGDLPFKTNSIEELKKWVIYGDLEFIDNNIDPQIHYLIRKLTNKDPKKRPTAEKLLKLPMFETIAAKKTSLFMNQTARRNSYTTGITIQSNLETNKSLNMFRNRYIDDPTDTKKQNFQNCILTYRKIFFPILQRKTLRNISRPM